MTDAEKRRSEELAAWEYWESLPKQPTPLNAEMVESGEISVECGYEDEEIKVSVLTLGPHAAIRSHKHSSDEEEYYNLDTFEKIGECKKGYSHSLKNEKDSKLNVLSIKFKEGIR